jgi:hypothetical protein
MKKEKLSCLKAIIKDSLLAAEMSNFDDVKFYLKNAYLYCKYNFYELKLIINKNAGDLMPLEEWKKGVIFHCFINYDGYGHLATTTHVSNIYVSPSDLFEHEKLWPKELTHILWYNR